MTLTTEADQILSVEEAAEIAGCCVRTLKAHLRAGRYPGTMPGGRWRVPKAALIKAISDTALVEAALRREREQKRAAAQALAQATPAEPPAKRPRGRPPRISYDHILGGPTRTS